MRVILFILSFALVYTSKAQTADSVKEIKSAGYIDSIRNANVLFPSRYAFPSRFNTSNRLMTPNAGGHQVQLYADPIYLQRNAFPVHTTTAETLIGGAAKIAAQVLVPNARVQ